MVQDTYRDDSLSGRRALVTGGAQGIGEAIVRALAEMGAEVVIVDVNDQTASQLVAELTGDGHHVSWRPADLADPEAIDQLATEIGVIDVLVNNAAPRQSNSPFMDTGDDEWELQFAIIMWAPLRLIRTIGAAMAVRGRGSIVNLSSAAATRPATFVAPYAAAKAALEIITKVAALELGPSGVRANAVAPSFIPTERNRPTWEKAGFNENMARSLPAGRMPTTADVAAVVAWLASDASSFVSGQVINVDGGSSAGIFTPPAK